MNRFSGLAVASVFFVSLLTYGGCSSDSSDGGSSGSAGTAGSGGTAGTGGTAGSGGSSGSGGTAGTAGSGGTAGTAGTGGTAGSAGTGGTAGAGGTGSVTLDCASYCSEVATNCAGDQDQYASEAACMGVCATFNAGTIDDQAGATLGCRLYHGGAPAAAAPATHCGHAGPLGEGVCGDDCANFCAIATAVCGSQPTAPYADNAACLTACAGFADTTAVPYNTAATSGDSLACRMYHLSVASSDAASATTHCPHIAEVSPVCQ